MKKSPALPEVAVSACNALHTDKNDATATNSTADSRPKKQAAPRRRKKTSPARSDSKKKSVTPPKQTSQEKGTVNKKTKSPKKQPAASNVKHSKACKESTVKSKPIVSKVCQADSPTPEKDIPSMISLNTSNDISTPLSLEKTKHSRSGSKKRSGKMSRKAKKSRKVKPFSDPINYGYEGEIDLELEDNAFSEDDLSSLEAFETLLSDPKNDLEEDDDFSIPEPVVVSKGPRKKVQRRRQIDPTTCERDYSSEEVEFMNALDEYKRTSGRMFPTCSEILEVLLGLGYIKTPLPTEDESLDVISADILPESASVEEPSPALEISIYQEEDLVISTSLSPVVSDSGSESVFAVEPMEVAEVRLEIPAFLLEEASPSVPGPHEMLFPLDFGEKVIYDTRSSRQLTF